MKMMATVRWSVIDLMNWWRTEDWSLSSNLNCDDNDDDAGDGDDDDDGGVDNDDDGVLNL